ncbi:hypothetical protein [Dethiosulfatarculus sandiegensis]|nr:hypothetical protein [Dethiosulfatarculus sandiegensis]
MPTIELKVSEGVYNLWQAFLKTPPARKLIEERLLGDWAAQAFMAQAGRFLKEGLPDLEQDADPAKEREKEAAAARKNLTKMQKRVLPMFNENENQTLAEISRLLGLDRNQAENLLQEWLEIEFLGRGPMRDGEQTYVLTRKWMERNLSANRPSLNAPRNASLLDSYRPPTR